MINASHKFTFTNPSPRGSLLNRWSDGIRENSGVPLLSKVRSGTPRPTKLVGDAKSYATKSSKSHIYIYIYIYIFMNTITDFPKECFTESLILFTHSIVFIDVYIYIPMYTYVYIYIVYL